MGMVVLALFLGASRRETTPELWADGGERAGATQAGIVVEIAKGLDPAWLPWTTLALAVVPIALAGSRTVPSAVRLGTRRDDIAGQSRLARRILADHLVCLACIAIGLALQLGSAAR